MRDDGRQPDAVAEDGIYSAGIEVDGIRLVWTVQTDRAGSLRSSGSVVIQAQARYPTGRGRWGEIRVGTLRANPLYVGMR